MVDLLIWLIVIETMTIHERHRRYRLVNRWLRGEMTEDELQDLKKQSWFKWKPMTTDPPSKKVD